MHLLLGGTIACKMVFITSLPVSSDLISIALICIAKKLYLHESEKANGVECVNQAQGYSILGLALASMLSDLPSCLSKQKWDKVFIVILCRQYSNFGKWTSCKPASCL